MKIIYWYLGKLEADTSNICGDEKKKKWIPQEYEEATQKQTTKQNSYGRNKNLDSTPHKIFWVILKVQDRTSTNRLENKKNPDGTSCFISQKWRKHIICAKKRWRKTTYQQSRERQCINIATRRLDENVQKKINYSDEKHFRQHKHQQNKNNQKTKNGKKNMEKQADSQSGKLGHG